MLQVEKGGEQQIPGELEAYNPLVPQGSNLVFTLMFGFETKNEREEMLGRLGTLSHRTNICLGWIEDNIYMKFEDVVLRAVPASPAEEADRTTPGGKTSAVHFLKFTFDPRQVH